MITHHNVDSVFKYHPPTPDVVPFYEEIRGAGKALAIAILNNTPQCSDQQAAIRKVREAVMTANAAIALAGEG